MRDKKNDMGGKGTRWKGQRAVNGDEGIDYPGGSDNHHAPESWGMRGKMIIKITGGSDYRC